MTTEASKAIITVFVSFWTCGVTFSVALCFTNEATWLFGHCLLKGWNWFRKRWWSCGNFLRMFCPCCAWQSLMKQRPKSLFYTRQPTEIQGVNLTKLLLLQAIKQMEMLSRTGLIEGNSNFTSRRETSSSICNRFRLRHDLDDRETAELSRGLLKILRNICTRSLDPDG